MPSTRAVGRDGSDSPEPALDPAEFYDAWFAKVYAYFRRRTPSHEVAEDLTSETFERIVRALPRFRAGPDAGRSTRVWVYRIAGNVYKNSLRSRGRRQARLEAYAEGWVATADDVPGSDARVMVAAALGSLDGDDRNILGLRFWEGLTAKEIGDVVGMSQREVYTAIERCMRQLQRELRPLMEEAEGGDERRQ